MTTFPKNIVEKLQAIPGGVINLIKKGESNFKPEVPPPQPPDNPSGYMFEFSTHNDNNSELPIALALMPKDNNWTVVDADTGKLLVNAQGATTTEGILVTHVPPGEATPYASFMIVFSRNDGGHRKYKVSGKHYQIGIGLLEEFNPGVLISKGSVIVHRYLDTNNKYFFAIKDANLTVPLTLPRHITDLAGMFAGSNQFNQDLSRWDTSQVTAMNDMFSECTAFNQDISKWDVSNVTSMNYMFSNALAFNQDLSPWCVKKIPNKPTSFDSGALRWSKPRPQWGTCPGEEVIPPYVPPVEEEVDDNTVIKAFDFAVIRYIWTPTGGEDLDTRTYLTVPERTGRKVGWKRLKNDGDYLIWNEDNTGVGVESVLVDIDKIHTDYPNERVIVAQMDGFWYANIKSGKFRIEFATFKGGKMVASGYDWVNQGGRAIQILKLGVDTLVHKSDDIDGEHLATLSYDTLLKQGTLVAREGPSSGNGDPEVPVIPPEGGGNGPGGIVDPTNPVYPDSEQGFTFSVKILDNDGGSVPFDIRLVKVAPGWKVYSGNTLILSADKIHPQVSAKVAMGDVTLTFNIPRKDIKTYTIIADASSLAFEVTQTSFSGQDIVINRFSSTILNHQFSVTDAILRVPTVLPSYITSTFNMFLGANQFNQDISGWDTSNVTNMSGMFDNAEAFNQDIGAWDVSNVTNMMFMFRYAHKFNQPIGSWNVKNVTNMKSMFESAPAFNQDLSKWCVRKIATKPDRFDYSAHALYTSHLPVWGTCPVAYPPGIPLEFNLTTPDDPTQSAPLTFELEEWGTGWALYEDDVLISNSEIMGPGVSHSMGGHNRQIIKIDHDNFANKTVNYKMFVNNNHLNVSRGFNESSSIYPTVEVLSFSDTSRRQSLRFAWTDMTVPTVLPQNINSTVTMFDGCQRFNQDISMWDTSYVEDMSAMFRNCISFNQPIGGWDVRNVTDLSDMFSGCTSFNQDLSRWAVSKVKRLQGTFRDASVFNSDISGWNLDSVMDYQSTFKNAREFNQDIGGWNTSNVLYTSQMFSGAYSFNQDISKWDVKQVQLMKEMFYEARSFNQDLSGWCVTNIPSKPNLFSDGAVAWTKPKPVWGTCPVIVEKTIQFDVDNTANDYTSVFEIQALSSDFFNISRDGKIIYVSNPITGDDEITESNTWPNKTVTIQVPPRTIRSYSVSSDNGLPKFVLATNAHNENIASIHVKGFDAKTPHYQFNVYSWPLYVEDTLPATVTSAYMMFYGCKAFNTDLSDWDVSNLTNMEYMFYNAETFNQDLSGWNVSHIPTEPTGFSTGTTVWTKPKPIWGTSGGPGGPSYDDTGAFKFIVNGAPEVSEVAIEMYDPNPDWVLLRDGVLVGGGLQGNGTSITFANTDKSSSEYVLIGSDFVTVLNEGGWSAEVDSIEVTQFPSKTVAVRFGLGGIPFTVPTTLPKNITTLGSMFSGCTKFNQDISMWDTSHVTEMYEVFKDCATFNQPLNTWDVSKIPELRGMFQGASVFNQPLDKWNVSAVTNVSEMFRYASKFNQDLSSWNVSNVTNMSSMFSYASAFNQDLSKWCVTNLPQKPSSFDERASAWTKPKPVWGTCPDINGPVTDPNLIDVSGLGKPYLFNTSNVTDPSKEMVLSIQIYQYTSWQLVDLDSNQVIANSRGYFAPGIKDNQSQSDSADMQLARNKAGVSNYALYAGGSGVSFNNSYRGSDTVAKFNLTQWGTGTTNAAFMLGGTATTVPNELSPSITSTSSMFSNNNLFNQDISKWDVSKVVSMDDMFSQATSFNRDLSGWDVSLIPVEPTNFALLAKAWTLPKPKWGTTGGSNPPSGLAPFSFTTSNRMASAPLPIALRVVSSGQAWSLIDAETKVVIHEVVEGNTPGEEEVLYLDELGEGAERRYTLEGAASEVNLSIDDEGRSDGFIKVESFSGDINQYKYDVKNADITVPLLLPKNVTNTDNMFAGCYNFNTDITGWDTSAITSMEGMFMGCASFNQDIGGWDVSNVTNMANMFDGCMVFNGDISSWKTSSLENLNATFSDCEEFNQNLNGWDVSKVTDMGMLFVNCRMFNQPLDNWNTSSCTTFSSCFSGATIFNQNINNWDVSKANDLNYVFSNALAFNQPLDNWVIPELYSLEATFMEAASFNQDISTWNVSLVHDMSYMFQGAKSFNKPLNDWDTSSFSYANGMFDGAHNFNQPLDKWKTSSLSRMSTMFSEATSFNQDLSSWCMSNVDMSPHNFSSGCLDWAESKPIWGTCDDEPARTFDFTFTAGDSVAGGAKIRILIRNLQGGWELYRNDVLISSRTVTDARIEATPSNYGGLAILIEPVANSSDKYKLKLTGDALELGYTGNDGNKHSLAVTQFSNGIKNHEFSLYKIALTVPEKLPTYVKSLVAMFKGSDNFNQNINTWDVAHIEEFTECFKDCTTFNQPLDTWEMGRSYSVESMFENCTAFNQDISSWDVTGQSRLLKMFSGCTSFNQSLDAWDVSNVWSFESMFNRCSSLNQDFTNWTINNSTGVNFYGLFEECTAFNGDITKWDTSRVGTTERMFTGCSTFNRDISGWDTAKFTNMSYMFENAISFNQDLSSWNVVKFPTLPYQFAGNTPSWTKPKPIWGTDGQVVLPPGPIETSPADFNLTINQLQPDTPTGISGVIVISDNATYWSVWCEGEQVAGNGIYGSADGTIKVSNRKITITNRTKRTQLAIKGYMSSVKVTVNAPTESDDRKLSVDVLNFSPTIGSHQFTTRDCALSVPETLPTTIDKLNDMFKMCYNITTDITGWDTSRVKNMDWMFWLAKNFNQDLSVWNVEQIPVEPVNFADGTDAWVLPKPIWGTNAGVRDPELEAPKPEYTPFEFNITASKTVGMRLEVSGVSGPWQIYKDDVLINMGDESFGIQYIENIEAGVTNIQVYAEGGNISIADMNEGSTDSIDFISFCAMIPQHMFRLTNSNFTVPEVLPITQTDTSNMFNGCNLFNQDISGWDTSHVTKMAAMFSECVAFNQPIGNWDVSKVTWFNGMFNGAHIFNHDLSDWDLSSAIYTHEMFYSALAFNQDISKWNVTTVTDMHGMFRNAYAFNQDISGWDVSGVTSMDYMFFVAKVFNQDLSSWNVSLIPDLPPYFDTAADAWTKPKPVWGSAGLAAPTL